MGYVQNSKIRVGRVRATKRIVSKPDHRGRSVVLAREGEEMSVEEAYRRRVPASAVEGIGPSAQTAVKALRDAHKAREADKDQDADAIIAEARQAAVDAERQANQDADGRRAAAIRGDAEYPQHRGGANWLLSDGTTFSGSPAEADAAEAELTGGATPADPDAVPDGKVDEVLAWVDGDKDRAAKALEAEQAKGDKARTTLTGPLEELLEPPAPDEGNGPGAGGDDNAAAGASPSGDG